MYYSDLVKKAVNIAFNAHKEQIDKAGYPYVFHPYHLAEQFSDEDSVVVALLHDVVEDTDWTLEGLREEGFPDRIIEALTLLTHADDLSYDVYIDRISANPLARRVKIADLKHNCDTTRGAETLRMQKKREEYYYLALKKLLSLEEND